MKILKSHNSVFMQNCNNSYKSVFKLKIFYLILLFLIFINNIVYSQNYWIKNPSPTSLILTEVYFINNNTGWIAGDSGAVFRTTDQGLNWIVLRFQSFSEICLLPGSDDWICRRCSGRSF